MSNHGKKTASSCLSSLLVLHVYLSMPTSPVSASSQSVVLPHCPRARANRATRMIPPPTLPPHFRPLQTPLEHLYGVGPGPPLIQPLPPLPFTPPTTAPLYYPCTVLLEPALRRFLLLAPREVLSERHACLYTLQKKRRGRNPHRSKA